MFFSRSLVFVVLFTLLSTFTTTTADLLLREECYCRKRLFGDNGSLILLTYHNHAVNDTALIDMKCRNHHCIIKGFFGNQKKCSPSLEDKFELCYDLDAFKSDHITVKGKLTGDHSLSINDDDGEPRGNYCDKYCAQEFGLPMVTGLFAPTSEAREFKLQNQEL